MSATAAPVPKPCTPTIHGRGPSSCSNSHADAVRLRSNAAQRSAPGSSRRGSYALSQLIRRYDWPRAQPRDDVVAASSSGSGVEWYESGSSIHPRSSNRARAIVSSSATRR